MPLVTSEKMLLDAQKGAYAVGAFNVENMEMVKAVIAAAEELNQPVILAHAEVHNVYNDISIVGPAMIAAAKNAKVPVCVHLDHGVTIEMIERALDLGFTSIMIDASHLPFEENLKLTKKVTEKAHSLGVSVEAELGRLVTSEDGTNQVDNPESYYTDKYEAKLFVEKTGIDALAIAFGTAHGFYKSQPKLSFEVVSEVRSTTRLPLVMHGGSGVSEEGFKKAIESGIRKINYYSYMSMAGYIAVEDLIKTNSTKYLHDLEYAAMKAMKEDVKKAIKVFSNL